MELLAEILAEILFEVYGELMFLIIPEKRLGKTYNLIVKIIAVMVFLGVIALVIWGGVLIWECKNLLGIIPLVTGVFISLAQIIAGIILYNKHH